MKGGAADVGFDAEHPAIDLIIVTDLAAAESTEHPGIVDLREVATGKARCSC
jgi:hypothetical protein